MLPAFESSSTNIADDHGVGKRLVLDLQRVGDVLHVHALDREVLLVAAAFIFAAPTSQLSRELTLASGGRM